MMSIDDVLREALNNKVRMDDLIRQSDRIYVCMECKCVTDYYKPGGVCGDCELKSDLYEDER